MRTKLRLIPLVLLIGILFAACSPPGGKSGQLSVVTSFYPVYVTVLNITDGCQNIAVSNLTNINTGCLHDYSLTTSNLKELSSCDALIINGAGMEPFMDKIQSNAPKLTVIDTSASVQILDNNPHIWLDFNNLYIQIDSIAAQLASLSPENSKRLSENANAYKNKLMQLQSKMETDLAPYKGEKIVTFHEAFDYFAKEFDLTVAATIQHDEHSAPTPGEIAQTISLIQQNHIKAIFAEPGNADSTIQTVSKASGAKVYTLDPVVTPQSGVADKDAYISAMENNLNTLKVALKK